MLHHRGSESKIGWKKMPRPLPRGSKTKSENRMEDNASPSAQQMDTRCVREVELFSQNLSKIEVLGIEGLDVERTMGKC